MMISFSSTYNPPAITLILYGDDLDSNEVSSILDISPRRSFKKGDFFSNGTQVRKYGMWSVEVKNRVGEPLSLDGINKIIPEKLRPVSKISGVTSGRLALWIDEDGDKDAQEIMIDKEDIELINSLGVDIYITIFRGIEERSEPELPTSHE